MRESRQERRTVLIEIKQEQQQGIAADPKNHQLNKQQHQSSLGQQQGTAAEGKPKKNKQKWMSQSHP